MWCLSALVVGPYRDVFGEHLEEHFREYFWASGAGPFRSRIGFEKLGSDLAPGADLAAAT